MIAVEKSAFFLKVMTKIKGCKLGYRLLCHMSMSKILNVIKSNQSFI